MSIRWGIIGPGNIARQFAEDMREVSNGTITAVCSRKLERAQAFAQEFKAEHSFDSIEKMLQSDVCDVVYIATPHTSHQQDTITSLQNGKHVLCEKPITVNAAQLSEVIRLQKEKNLFCMEAYWTVFHPAVIKAFEWIQQGKIGTVALLQANFGFQAPFIEKGRLFNMDLAGGSLLDVGIYPVMFADVLFDAAPEKIYATATLGKTGVDELTSFQINYSNGRVLQGSSSVTYYLENRAVIFGDKGRIEIEDFWMSRRTSLITDSGVDIFEDERITHGYNYEAEAVGKLINEGKTSHPVLTLERSQRNMQTLDEIRRQIGLSYPFE